MGGIPLDEIGATAWGLSHAADVAATHSCMSLRARVAVQGFGAVGKHAARFLSLIVARFVAAADSRGTIYDPDGLGPRRAAAAEKHWPSVCDYPQEG